jgi:hypothetical protein
LKKPAKTREELESAIRLEMEDICEWPTDLAISVAPHEDTWKVVIMTDGPQDADRCDMIGTIADRLRTQFDLKADDPGQRGAPQGAPLRAKASVDFLNDGTATRIDQYEAVTRIHVDTW